MNYDWAPLSWCPFHFNQALRISLKQLLDYKIMIKKPYLLAHCHYRELLEREIKLAILPWGACEAHNYHLPYATDIIEADHITDSAAHKAYQTSQQFIVLPTIPYGVNTGQTDILLDINIYPSTQQIILNNIIEVLNRQGIYKLLIINSHGGNNFRTMLRELGVKYPAMFLTTCDWFKALDKTRYFEKPGDHADEMETSLMMYYTPELVFLEQAGSGKSKQIKVEAIRQGWAWAERRWSQVTEDTGVGDPSLSTAEKGRVFHEDVTEAISKLILELCDLDTSDAYQ